MVRETSNAERTKRIVLSTFFAMLDDGPLNVDSDRRARQVSISQLPKAEQEGNGR